MPGDLIMIMLNAVKNVGKAGRWWRTPLIPALGRQRQADLCELEVSLVYRVSSRTGSKATQRNKSVPELPKLQLQAPSSWDHRPAPPYLVYVVQEGSKPNLAHARQALYQLRYGPSC